MKTKTTEIKCSILLPLLQKMQEQLDYLCAQRQPEPWMDRQEVMHFFRISSSTYYKWKKNGILVPSSSLGEDRYLVSDIQSILKNKEYRERNKTFNKS